MGICLEFVRKTVLITQGYFHYCWMVFTQESGPSLLLTPPARGLRVHEELGGDRAWTAYPTDQRDIPDHMASWSVCRARGRRKEGLLEQEHLSSQASVTHHGAPMPWKWMDTCLSLGSGEWIPWFAFPIKLSWSQPTSSHYYPPDSPAQPAGSKWLGGA